MKCNVANDWCPNFTKSMAPYHMNYCMILGKKVRYCTHRLRMNRLQKAADKFECATYLRKQWKKEEARE